MRAIGIDVGSLSAQSVLLEDGRLIASQNIPVGPRPVETARTVLDRLLEEQRLGRNAIDRVVATGYGREQVETCGLADANVSEISCHGAGAHFVLPRTRTIIDVGGQDAKAIRIDDRGNLMDFAMNDKCAAGTGRFLEVMSRTLDVGLDALGPLSIGAREAVSLSARCSIYCETEVLHFMQRGMESSDLALGICRAMSERVAALARRVGVAQEVTMSGGVAKNIGVRNELSKILGVHLVRCPVDPQIIGALGAAVRAMETS